MQGIGGVRQVGSQAELTLSLHQQGNSNSAAFNRHSFEQRAACRVALSSTCAGNHSGSPEGMSSASVPSHGQSAQSVAESSRGGVAAPLCTMLGAASSSAIIRKTRGGSPDASPQAGASGSSPDITPTMADEASPHGACESPAALHTIPEDVDHARDVTGMFSLRSFRSNAAVPRSTTSDAMASDIHADTGNIEHEDQDYYGTNTAELRAVAGDDSAGLYHVSAAVENLFSAMRHGSSTTRTLAALPGGASPSQSYGDSTSRVIPRESLLAGSTAPFGLHNSASAAMVAAGTACTPGGICSHAVSEPGDDEPKVAKSPVWITSHLQCLRCRPLVLAFDFLFAFLSDIFIRLSVQAQLISRTMKCH